MRSAECGEWGAEKKLIKKCACDDNRITNVEGPGKTKI